MTLMLLVIGRTRKMDRRLSRIREKSRRHFWMFPYLLDDTSYKDTKYTYKMDVCKEAPLTKCHLKIPCVQTFQLNFIQVHRNIVYKILERKNHFNSITLCRSFQRSIFYVFNQNIWNFVLLLFFICMCHSDG